MHFKIELKSSTQPALLDLWSCEIRRKILAKLVEIQSGKHGRSATRSGTEGSQIYGRFKSIGSLDDLTHVGIFLLKKRIPSSKKELDDSGSSFENRIFESILQFLNCWYFII